MWRKNVDDKENGGFSMQIETIVLNEKRNVTLTAYIQKAGEEFRYVTKRPAILILPGGAINIAQAEKQTRWQWLT